MKYAIVGSGKIGTALARTFAQNKVDVGIANSRGPETLAPLSEELGSRILPQSLEDACGAELIFLAVPFSACKDVAKQADDWRGKIVVDATNAFRIDPGELNGLLSSELIAKTFAGARLVKAFNHLPAQQLGTNAAVTGQRQAIFVSSNDADASAIVAELATQLGFAPVELGRLDKGGVPLHVVEGRPGGLLLQNLAKLS